MDRYYRKVYIYCANNTKYGRGALKLRWLRLSGAYFKCTPRHEQIVQV